MTYKEFERALLIGIGRADLEAGGGRVSVFEVADAILPRTSEQWVLEALNTYDDRGWLAVTCYGLRPRTVVVQLNGAGRLEAGRVAGLEHRAGGPRHGALGHAREAAPEFP